MKKIYWLLLVLSKTTIAQNNKTVTGSLINQKTKQSVPFVTVIAKNSSEVQTEIADEDGFFLIKNLTKNLYRITIKAIGYKTVTKPIAFGNKNSIDLGTVYLNENIEALEAVVIRSPTTTVTQKIDRLVINVGKDLTSNGTDAASVLNNVQSVSVDQQTGELSLRGNANVRVLIDGKPSNIPTDQLIQQLPANAIKNIEIITNPSAKYNPEGNSGIINIELIKNKLKGFNGSVNYSLEYGRNLRRNEGISLNYKKNKVNFFTNYNYRGGDKTLFGKFDRTLNYQNFTGIDSFENHLIKLGTDIDFTKKFSATFFTVQRFNDFDYINTAKVFQKPNNTIEQNSVFDVDRKPRTQTYDASFRQIFDNKKHTLDFGINYNIRSKPENRNWSEKVDPTNKVNNYFENIDEKKKNIIINVDYSKPIDKNTSLELGLQYRQNTIENNNESDQSVKNLAGADVAREELSFDLDRKIYSAYGNYRKQLNKLGIQAGLRIESYILDANFYATVDNQNLPAKDEVISLYPSLFLTYDLKKRDKLQFSYSRRVDRPSPKKLTPIRRWGTPLLVSEGNPNLKQQFTNSFELKYLKNTKIGMLSFTGFYRLVNDAINRKITQDLDNADLLIVNFDNFDDTHNYGVELAGYLKFFSWWKSNISTDFYYQQQYDLVDGVQIQSGNLLFNFRMGNSFVIGKKLSLQIFQMLRGLDKNVQREREPMYMLNTAASYKVLKNKGTISLGVSDIFNSFRARFTIQNPKYQQGEFNWESQKVTLGFVYNFGKQFKQKRKPKRPASEERDTGGGGVL